LRRLLNARLLVRFLDHLVLVHLVLVHLVLALLALALRLDLPDLAVVVSLLRLPSARLVSLVSDLPLLILPSLLRRRLRSRTRFLVSKLASRDYNVVFLDMLAGRVVAPFQGSLASLASSVAWLVANVASPSSVPN